MTRRPLSSFRRSSAALGDGLADDLGHGVGVLRRFEHNFAADVLNADLYFHSEASQPIKVDKCLRSISICSLGLFGEAGDSAPS